MRAVPIRNALFLVRNGVPFDTAFQLDEVTCAAFCIILSEQDGSEFSFETMSYKDRS